MRITIGILFLLGAIGWVLAVTSYAIAPSETVIQITVTKDSLKSAQETCERWRKNSNGVVGHVMVEDDANGYYSLPCRVLLEGK